MLYEYEECSDSNDDFNDSSSKFDLEGIKLWTGIITHLSSFSNHKPIMSTTNKKYLPN